MKQDEIGKYLKELRLNHSLTQKELAEKVHITHQAVSSWENGKTIPDIETLKNLSIIYNVTVDDLLNQTKQEKPIFHQETVRNRGPVFMFFISMPILLTLIILSLFFVVEGQLIEKIFFAFLAFIPLFIYIMFVKIENHAKEYFLITGLFFLITLIAFLTNMNYFLQDSSKYLKSTYEEDIIYPRSLGVETKTLTYFNTFDEYAIIYNTDERDIDVFNINNLSEKPRTISTGNYKVKDVFVLNDDLYFTSYIKAINGEYTIHKIDFETGTNEIIHTLHDVYFVVQTIEQTYLITDPDTAQPHSNGGSDVYIIDNDESIHLILEADYVIYDLAYYEIDFIGKTLLSTAGVSQSDDFKVGLYNSFLELEEIVLSSPGRVPYKLDSNRKITIAYTDNTVYSFQNGEYETKEFDGFANIRVISDDLIRVEDSLYTKDLELYTDFLYYNDKYNTEALYLMINTNGDNFIGIDNEIIMNLAEYPPQGEEIISLPYRIIFLVLGFPMLPLFIVIGHRKNN